MSVCTLTIRNLIWQGRRDRCCLCRESGSGRKQDRRCERERDIFRKKTPVALQYRSRARVVEGEFGGGCTVRASDRGVERFAFLETNTRNRHGPSQSSSAPAPPSSSPSSSQRSDDGRGISGSETRRCASGGGRRSCRRERSRFAGTRSDLGRRAGLGGIRAH